MKFGIRQLFPLYFRPTTTTAAATNAQQLPGPLRQPTGEPDETTIKRNRQRQQQTATRPQREPPANHQLSPPAQPPRNNRRHHRLWPQHSHQQPVLPVNKLVE